MDYSRALKRSISATVAGAALLCSTAAFAGEVTIWCWDPNFNVAIMKEAAARYTAKHPDTTFNIVDFAKADVEQKLREEAAKIGGDAAVVVYDRIQPVGIYVNGPLWARDAQQIDGRKLKAIVIQYR